MNETQPHPARPIAFRLIRSRKLYVAVAAVAIYAVCGFYLLPHLVQRYTPQIIRENLNATAEIGPVRINPFFFTLEVEDFHLRDAQNRPVGGFEAFYLDLELSSIFHWAWTFGEVRFETPVVSVVLEPDGRLNLAELLPASAQPQPKRSDSRPPRLLLRNLRIQNGGIDIVDRGQDPPATVRMRPLNFELERISTLPERRGPYSLIASTPAGESLHWTGQVSLNPLHSIGNVSFQNLAAATLWEFVRNRVELEPPEGTLDLSTTYELEYADGQPQLTLGNLGVRLADLVLKRTGSREPFFALAEARVSAADFDLQSRRMAVEEMVLENGQLALAAGDDGVFNIEGILRKERAPNSRSREAGVDSGSPWNLELNRFRLDEFGLTFRRPGLTATLGNAAVGFGLQATLGPQSTALRIRDLTATLRALEALPAGAREAPLVIETIALQGGRYESQPNRLSASRVAVTGGNVDVIREDDGAMNLVQLFSLPERGGLQKKRQEALEAGQTFRFRADTLALASVAASFSDRTLPDSPRILTIDPVEVTVYEFDGQSPSKFEAGLKFREGGSLTASGSFDPAEPSLRAQITVERLALHPLEPYLQSVARVRLPSGEFSGTGELRFDENPAFQGGFTLSALEVTEETGGELLMGWRKMEAPELRLELEPGRIDIGEVGLSGFFGKLIIGKDGTINLAEVIRKGNGGQPAPSQQARSRESSFTATVARVRFSDSQLDFADLSLPTPFATLIHDLEGVIAGIASKPDTRAQIELDGQVDEYGTASIGGEINAFDPLAFTAVTMQFRNVAMSKLSPYSARFAGRRIESGKLSLDLEYEIDRGQLLGDNQIVIERIDLGERVDSPEAVDLPLDLAVALLSDSNGVIDIGLPVRGDLNDPEFRFGHLIWKALANLLTKVVTAPFRLLASLVGAEEENFDAVAFAPGESEVPPPEREKLHALADALAKRPKLTLVVQGRYAPELDSRQLKTMQLRRELAERTGRNLEPGQDPGPVDFNSPQIHETLQNLYVAAFGEEAYEAMLPAEPGPPDPTETGTGDGGSSVDPNRLWKEIFEQLVEVRTLPEDALPQLAQARARTVVAEITGAGEVSTARVSIRDPEPVDADGRVKSTLMLEAG